MPNVAILGTGLIGASVGLALREQGWGSVGWDPSPVALDLVEAMRQALGELSRPSAA